MTETSCMDVGPGRRRRGQLMPLLRVPRVGPARAGSVARVPRRPLVMGSLNDELDLALGRVHVVQPVEGADRVGVRGCPGADPRTGERYARSARRASHLAS